MASGSGSVRDTKLYDILEIEVTASSSEIRTAYRKLAVQYHPDKNPSAPPEAFHDVQTAYEVLSDDAKRADYDRRGMSAVDGTGASGFPGWDDDDDDMGFDVRMDDMFSNFGFGGAGGPRRKPQGRKGGKSPDANQVYEVKLEDLFKGKKVTMEVERQTSCVGCQGSGLKPKAKASDCPRCEGNGAIIVNRPVGPGFIQAVRAECPACRGSGEQIKTKDACKWCRGQRTQKEKRKVEWYIEKGMLPDDVVTLVGEGDSIPGCTPGDLKLHLQLAHHPTFSLLSPHSRDLLLTVSITLTETLLGLDRLLFTRLDGRGVRARLPGPREPGYRIIRPGQTMRVTGEGLPGGRKAADGDLWITWEVAWPTEEWMRARDPASLAALEEFLPPRRPHPQNGVDEEVEEVKLVDADFGKAKATAAKEEEQRHEEDGDDAFDGPQCAPS